MFSASARGIFFRRPRIMDRIQTLQIYATVVETGSFSKTADRLNVHVSVISKAVKYLEGQLATRLLNRTTRKISLTAEGEAFYEKCRFLLGELEGTFSDLSHSAKQAQGKLRVEMPSALMPFLVAKLPEFRRQYPQIQLIITTGDQITNLVDSGLDCSIRMGKLTDANHIARRLADLPLITCASKTYLEQFGEPAVPDELSAHAVVHYFSGKNRKIMPLQFSRNGETVSFKNLSATIVDDSNTLLRSVLAGLGISQLPQPLVQPYLTSGQLVSILPHVDTATNPVYLIYLQREFIPKRLAVFIEWVMALDWN